MNEAIHILFRLDPERLRFVSSFALEFPPAPFLDVHA